MERFPFDWKSPFEYLMAMAIQIIATTYSFTIAACILSLSVGFTLFLFAMSKVAKISVICINQKAGDKTARKRILEQLIEFLEFHSRMKQLSKNEKETLTILQNLFNFFFHH